MKQVIAGTLRSGAKRLALPLIGGLVALGLVGCSSQTAVDTGAVAQAPQQAQPTKPIAFAPIIGAPGSVSKKLNEFLVASAAQKSIPVVPTKEAEYTIRGYLVAAADPKGTKLSYIWDITDKSSKRAKRFQGDELIEGKKGGDAWALVDESAMQRVAAKTTDELLAWLPKAGAPGAPGTASVTAPATQPTSVSSEPAATNNAATAAAPTPKQTATRANAREPKTTGTVLAAANADQSAITGPIVAVVPPVTGAPGDGVTSLTDAMKRHLQSEGVKLGEGSSGTSYIVRGSVQLEKAVDGQQPITIRWLVYGPDGKQMEKAVVQRNKVPEGSLDGAWGQVADLAAGEAARSISKLINKPAS